MKPALILCSLLAILFTSCTAPGPTFTQTPIVDGKSKLYVYRPKKFEGGGTYPYIYLNGAKGSPLKNGGYIAYDLRPGTNTVDAKGGYMWGISDKSVDIVAQKGKTYYIKLDYQLGFGYSIEPYEKTQTLLYGNTSLPMNYGARFYAVEHLVGHNEIQSLKLSH